MAIELNHTIVWSKDQEEAANFIVEILGLPAPTRFGPFHVVQVSNDVSLDYLTGTHEFGQQHYAFLVSEPEFDEIFGRITERGLDYWADPFHNQPGEINRNDGGRGVYFDDPSGHGMEIITRPYGSGS
jgi:catechol 2,3-dioxygenase-like lactoylglutathione lyase family enzyme